MKNEGRLFTNPEIEKNSPVKRKEHLDNLLEITDEQLDDIGQSLHEFTEQVRKEQPDKIIFLDKGARLFGTPIKKYLESLDLPKMPEINFFNDHDLKGLYLKMPDSLPNSTDLFSYTDQELGDIRDKKIFFFDETFSSGKGAAAIKAMKDHLKNDNIFYFAISQDPNHSNILMKAREFADYGIGLEAHEEQLKKINNDKKFVVYNNFIRDLFSKMASSLYVDEISHEQKTKTVHAGSRKMSKLLEKENERMSRSKIKIPSAYSYTGENPQQIKIENYKTIAIIKEKIFNKLLEWKK